MLALAFIHARGVEKCWSPSRATAACFVVMELSLVRQSKLTARVATGQFERSEFGPTRHVPIGEVLLYSTKRLRVPAVRAGSRKPSLRDACLGPSGFDP